MTPVAEYAHVSPETAKEWLGCNLSNRALRRRIVADYARDMRAGKWQLSESAICFSRAGVLLNGQHRLHAVILADVTVTMLVLRGMNDDDQRVMDTGAKRGPGDMFHLAGEARPALLASTARWCKALAADEVISETSQPRYTHSELADFIDANPDIRESVALGDAWRRHIPAPPSVIAAGHWWIGREDPSDRVDVFFDKLATRVDEPQGSAVHALDARMREMDRRSRWEGRARPPVYLSLLVRAWNHWAAGTTISALPTVQSQGFRIPVVSAVPRSKPRAKIS